METLSAPHGTSTKASAWLMDRLNRRELIIQPEVTECLRIEGFAVWADQTPLTDQQKAERYSPPIYMAFDRKRSGEGRFQMTSIPARLKTSDPPRTLSNACYFKRCCECPKIFHKICDCECHKKEGSK